MDVASVLDELNFVEMCREAKVSPEVTGLVSMCFIGLFSACHREGTCGYMVKRISAHGGCLGGQRRRRTWQPAKSSGESATDIDPEMSEWGNPTRKRDRAVNT